MPHKNDFNKVETQAAIVKHSLTNLLNYYHKNIATEKEKANSENDKAMIDALVDAMKASVTISEIDPQAEKEANSKNRFNLNRYDEFYGESFYQEEQYDEDINRVNNDQVETIIRLLDQVSVRLENCKDENPENRASFGEMILASAITAAKLSNQLAAWNADFLRFDTKIIEFLDNYKGKLIDDFYKVKFEIDFDKIIRKIEDNKLDGLFDENTYNLVKYLNDRKKRSDNNEFVFSEVNSDIDLYVNNKYIDGTDIAMLSLDDISKNLRNEFNKIANTIYSNYLPEYKSNIQLLKMIERAHLQVMGFAEERDAETGKFKKSVDLPLDEKKLRERLSNALSHVDYHDLLALKQGINEATHQSATPAPALTMALLNAIDSRVQNIHDQLNDHPELRAKQKNQAGKKEHSQKNKSETTKQDIESDSDKVVSNPSPRKN